MGDLGLNEAEPAARGAFPARGRGGSSRRGLARASDGSLATERDGGASPAVNSEWSAVREEDDLKCARLLRAAEGRELQVQVGYTHPLTRDEWRPRILLHRPADPQSLMVGISE